MKLIRERILTALFFASVMTLHLTAGGNQDQDSTRILNVYCYDSFSSEWGPGPAITKAFTDRTGIEVILHAPGDAVMLLNQLILEKPDSRADVVIGLDSSLLKRTIDEEILQPYKSPNLTDIPDHLIFDPSYHLLPYDYGHFAINYDSLVMDNPPASLEELTREEYRGELILMDPRTSTPGLGFLLWTVSVYEDGWTEYWNRLKPAILTISDGWSQGYALYTAGEAPMILSYGTSPVYHVEYENSTRFKALEFSDGHIQQIEGMGIVKGTDNQSASEDLIDFMLELEAQKTLAIHNIMLPVKQNVPLPPSFNMALRPQNVLDSSTLTDVDNMDVLIDKWVEVFTR